MLPVVPVNIDDCEVADVFGLTHAPDASQYCVPLPPGGQVTTCEFLLLLPVIGVPPLTVIEGATTPPAKAACPATLMPECPAHDTQY